MELPITEKELEVIIKTLKGPQPSLHNKLWAYKMNYINNQNKEEKS